MNCCNIRAAVGFCMKPAVTLLLGDLTVWANTGRHKYAIEFDKFIELAHFLPPSCCGSLRQTNWTLPARSAVRASELE
jgi:hypothetical protein